VGSVLYVMYQFLYVQWKLFQRNMLHLYLMYFKAGVVLDRYEAMKFVRQYLVQMHNMKCN
jgi:hypothetical protein